MPSCLIDSRRVGPAVPSPCSPRIEQRASLEEPVRILAVDDDSDALDYLTSLLAVQHQVTACLSGDQAIQALHAGSYDLVLADLNMPCPDGFVV
ncbi:MAG: response regulator, partial [Candidatus Eisenbacteria bacterium]